MRQPDKKDIRAYRSRDFKFQFRIKCDGSYLDLSTSTVFFNASDGVDGVNVLSYSSADSPAAITIDADDNYLVTVLIDDSVITAITQSELYYEIDIEDASGFREPWLLGSIYVLGDAV